MWLPVLLGVAGGSLGWLGPRWRKERRSMFDETPAGMTREEYRRRRTRRARLRRYLLTILGALLGTCAGYVAARF